MQDPQDRCKICHSDTIDAGTKQGSYQRHTFHLRHCPNCRYSFVSDPWTDYAQIYDDAYYQGIGADPLVDYAFELANPQQTIRQYEWRGIFQSVGSLVPLSPEFNWLDFGCGNGGLVRYCRSKNINAIGFEEGFIAGQALKAGIPILTRSELDAMHGSFDIVTAIEVIEHVEDPLETLTAIRRLLKPGGLFFYTTGNAQPYRGHLPQWGYVAPELHISFYEPSTLEAALTQTGFRPEYRGFLPGFTDVLRFKILKNLKVRTCTAWERLLPWPLISRAANARFGVSGHPIGWAS